MSLVALVFGLCVFTAPLPGPGAGTSGLPAFEAHLDRLVPALLRKTGVPGTAVAVIRHGEVMLVKGYGVARRSTGSPVRASTLFNAGSIAKPLTAWGVMKLVEQGAVDLDAPVTRYVRGWVPEGPYPADGVTVRRLLAHTAGLSMSSVPGFPLDGPAPSLLASLHDPAHPVVLQSEPGASWSYSGGGYMVLQLLIEEVSGRPFHDFMRDEILVPLGMRNTRFGPSPDPSRHGLAEPCEGGRPVAPLRWPGAAAAGLYTTAEDLARFVAASFPRGDSGVVLRPASVRLMESPAPATERSYGTRYGLGHDIWPLADGRLAVGHNGQNTGWAGAAWWVPDTGDGLVVLTNDSEGMNVHRWILCDWISWAVKPSFGGYCAGRGAQPAGLLETMTPGPRDSLVDSLAAWWRGRVRNGEPGGVLSVRRWGRNLITAARGVRDLETGAPIREDTPFYLASVAKPLTAAIVKRLVDRGVLSGATTLGPDFPELPHLGAVTVQQLLDQTAGVPDYFQFIDWSRFRGLDDQAVVDTLANHAVLEHEPGRRFAYSNSHYVLLSELVRRRTGRSLAQVLEEEFVAPQALESLWIDDGDAPIPAGTARGYVPEGGGFRLSSYEEVDLPGPAPLVHFRNATTGAGGAFMSAPDLARWGEAWGATGALEGGQPVPVPPESAQPGIGRLRGYRSGWYVSELDGRTTFWHDGDRGGFKSVLATVPAEGLTVAMVLNRSDIEPETIVAAALSRLLDRSKR